MLPIRRIASRAVVGPSLAAAVAAASVPKVSIVQPAACRIVQALAGAVARTQKRAFSQSSAKLDEYNGMSERPQDDNQPAVREFRRPQGDMRRSVFVGNVAMELTAADVQDIFSEFGQVTDVVKGVGGSHWFVYFGTEEEATRVVDTANGTFVRGRQLRVQPRLVLRGPPRAGGGRPDRGDRGDRESRGDSNRGEFGRGDFNRADRPRREPSPTLFIGNMPYNMTDQDLNDLYKKLEYCFDFRVAIDRHTAWPRGYAHADFYTTGLAQRAYAKLSQANTKMGPNTLRFDFADTPRHTYNNFNLSRQRALKSVQATLEQYEELTEKLRREEGDWMDMSSQ